MSGITDFYDGITGHLGTGAHALDICGRDDEMRGGTDALYHTFIAVSFYFHRFLRLLPDIERDT